jgi:hypothetical protein
MRQGEVLETVPGVIITQHSGEGKANLFNAKMSDIDYYFASRLPGEPLGGVDDIHFHPAVPRTARLGLVVGL